MTEKNVGIPDEIVLSKIYMIRDQKVMLDKEPGRIVWRRGEAS
jgi:hypothetical protein